MAKETKLLKAKETPKLAKAKTASIKAAETKKTYTK